jgi:proto-oncogene C-crk
MPALFTVEALYNFQPKDNEDLGFLKGDLLDVTEQHEAQWWRARSQRTNECGCIPVNYVRKVELVKVSPEASRRPSNLQRTTSVMEGPRMKRAPAPVPVDTIAEEESAPPVAVPRPVAHRMPDGSERPRFIVARAKTDRVAHAYDKTALSFKADDVIHVTKQNENGLWQGQILGGDGKSGHFPFTLVQLMDSAEYDADIAELERKFNSDIDRGLA